MVTHSQLLNTTSGHIDQLFARVPPGNEFADMAETLVAAAAPARQRVSRQEADLPRAHHQFYTAPGPDQGQYCTLHTKTGLGQ